jgi:3D (Asp-Asp-Asp) domain-containing protein
MFITNSFVRKVVVTLGAAVGFVFVYETTIRDSRDATRGALVVEAAAQPTTFSTPLAFKATAYCKGQTTASGVGVRSGVAAADPTLLPVGSVIRIDTPDERYDGIWTVMDTGPAVQGRIIDLYMWSCHDALKFGRRAVNVNVMRLGWNPENSEPGIVDVLFRKRERDRAQMPIPAKLVDPSSVLLPVALSSPPL